MKPSDRIIAFIESLKVPDGALVGQPMALRGWQKKFIRQVYDPKGPDGLRLVRQALVTMGRKNGKTALISTQAADDVALFSELVDYGKKVNAGELEDDNFKAFIYEVPPEADVWDEKNWPLANPALGDFRSLKEMRETAEKAKRMPGQEAAFRNLYMNQRVSAEGRLIPPDVWAANAAEPDLDLFHEQPCWGGLDLSGKNDLTALVYVTRTPESKWAALPYFWTPGGNIRERADRDRAPYDLWARQGHLIATPGRTIDYAFVARQIAEMHGRLNIKGIKFDRWRIMDASDLVYRVRATWRLQSEETEAAVLQELIKLDLLVINELGYLFGTETERRVLFRVINRRYEHQRPTIVMGNVDREEAKAILGTTSYSRLQEEGGQVLVFDWGDYRERRESGVGASR